MGLWVYVSYMRGRAHTQVGRPPPHGIGPGRLDGALLVGGYSVWQQNNNYRPRVIVGEINDLDCG